MNSDRVLHGDARVLLPELAAEGLESSFRMAYADPPYNTRRSDRGPFPDRRSEAEWAGLIGDVARGIFPLLTDDGSFWLHVNDRQLGTAKAACDTAFGGARFVGTITWERTRRPSYIHGRPFASTTDFLLVYAKDPKKLQPFVDGRTEEGKRVPIAHRGNALTDLDFPAGSVRFHCPDRVYPPGDHSSPGIAAELLEAVTVAKGVNFTPLRLRLPSRYSKAVLQQMLADGAKFLIPKTPFRPSYLSPGGKPKVISNVWSWRLDDRVPTNEDAHKEQQRAGLTPFPYAKPVGLLEKVVNVATSVGDIVLDPFGGSGTTAQAARQTGRNFVIIEQQLDLIESYIEPRLGQLARPAWGRPPGDDVKAESLHNPLQGFVPLRP